ncbi:MAG: hypothetical protein ACE5HS_14200 [bacterium]
MNKLHLLYIAAFLVSCAAGADIGLKKSETEYGGGLHGVIGKQLRSENLSVHGLASYHRFSFDGWPLVSGRRCDLAARHQRV